MTRTAAQCLSAAIRIETLAQDLYAGLAVTYQHQPFLRDLFERLAAEEAQHAMRIRLLERHLGGATWAPQDLARISGDLDAMAAEMTAMKEGFRALAPGADARGVLTRLAKLETRFGSVHAEELARSANPEVHKLFAALATQDGRHRDFIQRTLGKLAA